MKAPSSAEVEDGDYCVVVGGTHVGKSGTVQDRKTSKTGHVTITVQQKNGDRFKTLARNVVVQPRKTASTGKSKLDQSGKKER